MTSEECAWAAGLLEGEGCFDLNNPSRQRCYPKIRMETTDPDVAYRLREVLSCGTIFPRKSRNTRHKNTVVFQITRSAAAADTMRALRPWMGQRRGAKIDEILTRWDDQRASQTR